MRGPSLKVDLRRMSHSTSHGPRCGDPHAISALSREALQKPIPMEETSETL